MGRGSFLGLSSKDSSSVVRAEPPHPHHPHGPRGLVSAVSSAGARLKEAGSMKGVSPLHPPPRPGLPHPASRIPRPGLPHLSQAPASRAPASEAPASEAPASRAPACSQLERALGGGAQSRDEKQIVELVTWPSPPHLATSPGGCPPPPAVWLRLGPSPRRRAPVSCLHVGRTRTSWRAPVLPVEAREEPRSLLVSLCRGEIQQALVVTAWPFPLGRHPPGTGRLCPGG